MSEKIKPQAKTLLVLDFFKRNKNCKKFENFFENGVNQQYINRDKATKLMMSQYYQ